MGYKVVEILCLVTNWLVYRWISLLLCGREYHDMRAIFGEYRRTRRDFRFGPPNFQMISAVHPVSLSSLITWHIIKAYFETLSSVTAAQWIIVMARDASCYLTIFHLEDIPDIPIVHGQKKQVYRAQLAA
jgi:hypothetical protein